MTNIWYTRYKYQNHIMRNQAAAKKYVNVERKVTGGVWWYIRIVDIKIQYSRLLSDTMPSSTLYQPWKWIANQEPRKSSQLLGSFPPFWRHPIVLARRTLSPSPATWAHCPERYARIALMSWTETLEISGGPILSFCSLWCTSVPWPSSLWRVQKLPFVWPGLLLSEIPPHTSRIPPLKDVTKSIKEK